MFSELFFFKIQASSQAFKLVKTQLSFFINEPSKYFFFQRYKFCLDLTIKKLRLINHLMFLKNQKSIFHIKNRLFYFLQFFCFNIKFFLIKFLSKILIYLKILNVKLKLKFVFYYNFYLVYFKYKLFFVKYCFFKFNLSCFSRYI